MSSSEDEQVNQQETTEDLEITALKMMHFAVQMDAILVKVNNDSEEQKLEKMKQILDDSEKDEWRYQKFEDLISC